MMTMTNPHAHHMGTLAEVAIVKESNELNPTFNGAKAETEMVIFACVRNLLDSLKLAPNQV